MTVSRVRLRQKAIFSPDYRNFSAGSARLRYDKIVEVFGGHGEFVEEAADIRPRLSGGSIWFAVMHNVSG